MRLGVRIRNREFPSVDASLIPAHSLAHKPLIDIANWLWYNNN